MTKYIRNIFLWIVPAVMLLITVIPIAFPYLYGLLLQIVVSLTAAIIAYLLFTEKPKYFIIWGIVFVLIVLIYNPIIHLSMIMGVEIPLNLITAIIFLANWWFVFRTKL